MQRRSQRENCNPRLAPWLRVLAVFCMALIAIASTMQVCHSHDDDSDVFAASLVTHHDLRQAAAPHTPDRRDSNSGSDSAVRCPLCIAMHSALPVSALLVQVALLRFTALAPDVDGIERVFRWRFEMATRPPPAMEARA